jgi:hypothetical protein
MVIEEETVEALDRARPATSWMHACLAKPLETVRS